MTEPTAAELVARARALQPLLREHAAETEADRRVADECIAALGEAGLFKVSVPRRYGGHEATLRTMLDVSAAVRLGCCGEFILNAPKSLLCALSAVTGWPVPAGW